MSALDQDKTTNRPESPTTAHPLDVDDDDDVQESGIITMDDSTTKPSTTTAATAAAVPAAAPAAPAASTAPANTSPTIAAEEVPPQKPPRPVTEQQKNEAILKEAFPSIDATVIKAVLRASGGLIDPAFNALLEMTDPDAVQHEAAQEEQSPPPQPPRPQGTQSQLEADELYARQLAQHYENVGAYEARTSNRGPAYPPRPRQETSLKPNELYDDREHSFIDDDLPVIQENIKKGFAETQQKVNTWFTNLKKKFDEQFDEDEQGQQQLGRPFAGRPSGEPSRRSRDYERYDADPQLLSDDFAGMKFHSDGTPARQAQNPNLFKPPPPSTSPKTGDNRKVAFKDSTDEIDPYNASPNLPPAKDSGAAGAPAGATKTSKWQPLSTVEPSPIAENDPFSLGDSDDDKDAAKDKSGGDKAAGGIETENAEGERLRKAAAEAMADSLVEDKAKADAAAKK